MTLKDGVNRQGTKEPIYYAIGIAEALYRYNGLNLVVTSLTDGQHKEDSLHYEGLAVDFRTRNVPPDLLRSLVGSLRSILDPMGYDVVLEKDHVHVEFDPKGRESWLSFKA